MGLTEEEKAGKRYSTELNPSSSLRNMRQYKTSKSTSSADTSRATGDRRDSSERRARHSHSQSKREKRVKRSRSSSSSSRSKHRGSHKDKSDRDASDSAAAPTHVPKKLGEIPKSPSQRFRFMEKQAHAKVKGEPLFSRNQVLIIMWFVWLLLGTCFYITILDLSIGEGFYMAVNIGYSIGWGDISETGELGSQLFSTLYVLIGASFVGASLGIFAERIVADKDNWYEQEQENMIFEEKMKESNMFVKAWYFYVYHKDKFRSIILWIVFVVIATFAAWNSNDEFGFGNSLYFAVSSLSTGGHYSLPGGNREWVYGLTGLYCAFGVPLMGIAMATIASFFITVGSIEDTLKDMKKPVSHQEIDMLTEFGLADEDGEIDKGEFIILCMVRTGAASPELIKLIEQYFNELDDDNSGTLSIDEILRNRDQASAAAEMLLDQVKHKKEENKSSRHGSRSSRRAEGEEDRREARWKEEEEEGVNTVNNPYTSSSYDQV